VSAGGTAVSTTINEFWLSRRRRHGDQHDSLKRSEQDVEFGARRARPSSAAAVCFGFLPELFQRHEAIANGGLSVVQAAHIDSLS